MPPKLIPFCEPWFDPACADVVKAQVLSGWVGPGPRAAEFAASLAKLIGAKLCLPTVSGTVALSVAAQALGLRPGDEIIVPAYGVISTINAFAYIGLRPRLADIEPATGCISAASVAARITPRTKAVCFVNFSGYTGDNLVAVADLCRAKGLPLIEDAACAFMQSHKGRYAGTFGTIGTLSFSVPKLLTTGQGGAVVTDSQDLHDKALCVIDQGDTQWRKTNLNRSIGSNLRFNDVLAAFGMAQLNSLDQRRARKQAVYDALAAILGDKLYRLPAPGFAPGPAAAPLHYVVFTAERQKLVDAMNAQNIKAAIQYRSIWEHPPFADLRDAGLPCDGAEYWNRHAVYLPFGMALTPEDGQRIGTAVRDAGVALNTIPSP